MTADDLGTTRRLFFPPRLERLTWTADLPAEVATYPDALALPLTAAARGPRLFGAAYDRDGRLIHASQRAKSNRAWTNNPAQQPGEPPDVEQVAGHTYFGGHLRPAFGHLLLEVLPRFWPDPATRAADRVVFSPTRVGETPRPRLASYEVDLLAALGVEPSRCLVVADRALRFERLTVATPAFWLKRGFAPALRLAFERAGDVLAAASTSAPAARVYLSRSRLGAGPRRALNEVAIEEIVTASGFRVVHPQELPLADQVRLVREAEVLAGCDGSALHLAAFARPGTKLVAFDSRLVPNQFILDQVARLDAVHALVTDGALTNRTASWTADLDRVRAGLAAALG